MERNTKIFIGWVAALLLVSGIIIYFGNRPQVSNQELPATNVQQNAKIFSKAGMGNFLVDAKGMTLYYFPKDTIGKSNCYGGCVTAWPLFYEEEIKTESPLSKNDFAGITRNDGTKQTAYKGWPLYYYYQDFRQGDTNGEGVGDVWYIVPEPFYTVMTANKENVGNYLVDPEAMALYYFTSDTRGNAAAQAKSNCTGNCLVNWPLFYSQDVIAPSLLNKGDFSKITRADGQEQLVYKGWPLYYYVQDKNPGDTKGEGVGNVWFLVKP